MGRIVGTDLFLQSVGLPGRGKDHLPLAPFMTLGRYRLCLLMLPVQLLMLNAGPDLLAGPGR